MVWIVFLALSSAELLGVGWWGICSSRKYLLWQSRLALRPGIFRYTRFVVRHPGYSLFLAYRMCPFRIDWGSVCNLCACCLSGFPLIVLSLTYGGISEVVWGTWWRFLHNLICRLRPNHPGGLQSCPCLIITPFLALVISLMVLLFSLGCFIKGDPKFGGGCFVIVINIPVSLLPTLWCRCPLTKKFSHEGLPLSPVVFIFCRLSSCSLKGGEIKIDLIKN